MPQEVALTPMLSQYMALKAEHPDSILFYRMGDFYEMFFEDAVKAAPLLEVQLTSRDRSAANPIPMCGVPHHSATLYVQKLLSKGLKVALCEQMEDPSQTKGLVKREVVRVLTPSLIGDPDLVSEDSTNVLACVCEKQNGMEACFFDLLAGQMRVGFVSSEDQCLELFLRLSPKEILISPEVKKAGWFLELIGLFPNLLITERKDYFKGESRSRSALEHYLRETQRTDPTHFLRDPLPLTSDTNALFMDMTSLKALEILKPSSEGGKSLFDVLNTALTPMGRRLLKEWLSKPLTSKEGIEKRLGAVDALVQNPNLLENLRRLLGSLRDLERLGMKSALGLGMPRDFVAIREALKVIPLIAHGLRDETAPFFEETRNAFRDCSELTDLLQRALNDEAPATLTEGGIFRDTFHTELSDLRRLSQNAKTMIASMELDERKQTGISTLKIKHSRVFGYTIEITKAQLAKVPPNYQRKQTIANGERFVTEELRNFDEKVAVAEERIKALERTLFSALRDKVSEKTFDLLTNARLVASLDVLGSFAQTARERSYSRPEVHLGSLLEIEEGRHPVIETLLPPGRFVPNSISLSEETIRTLLITGPNMAGKSTIMRQVALLSVLAQAGSFVPAKSAKISILDAVFTRIGSSDELSRGRSTFMVEMSEVARILSLATPRSLILIDEIGRGTSTYDGLSLAWSLVEFLHEKIRSKTLFATHFHELTALEQSLPGLRNANVLVEKWKNEIVFLHQLRLGICNRSYGIEVARLAGVPLEVLTRARDVLGHLETQAERAKRLRYRALDIHDNQMDFFGGVFPPESRSNCDVSDLSKKAIDKNVEH